MNCKQVQKLLPLSVGGDLEERREQIVAAHVRSCVECVDAAKEFHETRQLLREYESPAISKEVYAEIRRRVLLEIEAESTRLSPPQLVASLFRPRLAWALASALIIASMLAIYFTINRRDVEPVLAEKHPAKVHPVVKHEPDQGSPGDRQTSLRTTRESRVNDKRWIKVRPFQPKKSHDLITDRGSQVAGVSPQTNLVEPALFPVRDSDASEKPVRLEIQTKDPNIRIIWFSQSKKKPDLPSSKGI